MRALLLVLAVAACDDAIAIEVRSPPGVEVDRVELFIASDLPCTTNLDLDQNGENDPCAGISPKDSPTAGQPSPEMLGEVYHSDNPDPFVSKVDGSNTAWFRLEVGDPVFVPMMIAVGHGANGPNSAGLVKGTTLDESVQLRVDLQPAVPRLDGVDPIAGSNVQVWPNASPDRAPDVRTCVGVEIFGKRVFIVPDDDEDCDAVAAGDECNELVYEAQQGTRDLPSEATTCTFSTDVGGKSICRLGGATCDERVPGSTGCDNGLDLCIADEICGCTRLGEPGCVFGKLQAIGELTRIVCRIPVEEQVPGQTSYQGCTQQNLQPLDFNAPCDSASLAKIGAGVPIGPFQQKIGLFDGPQQGDMELSWAHTGGCTLGLRHEKTLIIPDQALKTVMLWTQVQIAETRFVILPTVLEFVPFENGACPVTDSICELELGSTPDGVLGCFGDL